MKIFQLFIALLYIIAMQSIGHATSEESEFETKWRLGVGVGKKPDGEENNRLYLQLETYKKKESLLWKARIYFQDRDPQEFFPEEPRFHLDIVPVIGGLMGGMLGWFGSHYSNSILPHSAFEISPQKTTLLALGMLAGVGIPLAYNKIKSQSLNPSVIILDYFFQSEIIDREESKIFLGRTKQELCNRDDDTYPIRRSPIKSEGSFNLFSCTLDKPIRHIVDIYDRLKTIVVFQENQDLSLLFSVDGISNDGTYVRNWNSFAILASANFGIPFSINPRLEEYIEDVKLRQRWESSQYPTYENVVKLILHSLEEIQEKLPTFSVNNENIKKIRKTKIF